MLSTTRKLTLSEPNVLENPFNGTRHIKWYLLDGGGKGYLVSWLEEAVDTHRPECMAFKVEEWFNSFVRVTSWNEEAVSHNRDAALALEEVVKQLEERFGVVVSVGDPASALRPGEAVSNAV